MQKTKLNGGTLSFTEAAELWKKEKPFYEVSTEASSKYWAEKAKISQLENKG